MPGIDPTERKKFIEEYIRFGFRIIPLHPNQKTPLVQWKKNYTNARIKYLFWKNPQANVGILIGSASHLIVLDIDNHAKGKEILREIMDNPDSVFNTTCVTTNRGLHLYYRIGNTGNKIQSKRINEFMELKGDGSYVVAPPSMHPNGERYRFIIPLSRMRVFSEEIFAGGQEQRDKLAEEVDLKHLKYKGRNMDCIRQILNRDLQVGERDESFFVLYHLLLKTGNDRDFAKKVIYEKNRNGKFPMDERELNRFVLSSKKRYNVGCREVRRRLPYVECKRCDYLEEGVRQMITAGDYWNAIDSLSPMEFKVWTIFKTGEVKGKNLTYISMISGISRQTLSKVKKRLLEEGYIKQTEL
jgi:hypothetical protein